MTSDDLLFASGIAVPFECENCGVIKRDPDSHPVYWNMKICFYGWCRKCGEQDGLLGDAAETCHLCQKCANRRETAWSELRRFGAIRY